MQFPASVSIILEVSISKREKKKNSYWKKKYWSMYS